MNLFDLTNVQKSIIDKKRERFILEYCILSNLHVLPELILEILHAKYHYMKYQLHKINGNIILLTHMSIIAVKCFTLNTEKYQDLFPNNVATDNKYNDIATFLLNNVMLYIGESDKFNEIMLKQFGTIDFTLSINECNNINTKIYPLIMDMKTTMAESMGYESVIMFKEAIIQNIKNIKPKHLDHIIINI